MSTFDNERTYDTNASYQPGQVWEIDEDWDVYGADGDKIGSVSDVHPKYLVVSKGFLFPTDKYIPVGAIENVSGRQVYLNVTKDTVDSDRWNSAPDDTDTGYESAGMDRKRTRRAAEAGDEMTIPEYSEELDVSKRETRRGIVRVRKDVDTERVSKDVPLREETVHVERHDVNRAAGTGRVPDDAFQEKDYEIPIRGEEAEVTKRAVVTGEVEIDKDVTERTERVSDTVRREHVEVEGADTDRDLDRR